MIWTRMLPGTRPSKTVPRWRYTPMSITSAPSAGAEERQRARSTSISPSRFALSGSSDGHHDVLQCAPA